MAKKQLQQQRLGAMTRVPTSDTPELRLTHAAAAGVPVVQEPAYLQHLSAVHASYGAGVQDAIGRLAVVSPAQRARRKRRRVSAAIQSQGDEEEEEDAALQLRGANTRTRTDVQFDAGHYLEALVRYTSNIRVPAETDLLRLENIVRQHQLHDNEQPSQAAFRMLLSYVQKFPPTQLRHYPAGSPFPGVAFVEERSNAWTLLGRKRKLRLTDDLEDTWVSPDQFFFKLWDCAAALAADMGDQDTLATNYGEVLLLRAFIAQLEAELAPRFAAFRAAGDPEVLTAAAAGEEGPAAAKRREGLRRHRRRLLEESHLWRLLAEVPIRGIRSRHELVTKLLEVIALGADPPLACSPAGGSLATVQEAAGLAATMLRMLLELYGSAEDSGYYTEAAGRIREHDRRNQRILLDEFLVEGFVGANAVLKSWPQRQALLLALRSRDRLRLLGLVMAKRRVRRGAADDGKYPSMAAAHDLAGSTGDTPAYIDVCPVEALSYIADDLKFAQSACSSKADDLALVAAHLARGAAQFRPDAAAQVAAAFERISTAMLARHEEGEKANVLTPASQAELRGSAMLLLLLLQAAA